MPNSLPKPAVALPIHKLSESTNTRSIDIHSWTITAVTQPISNAAQCDAMGASLGIPLPEMIFGNNSLEIHHQKTGWSLKFDAEAALAFVKNGELGHGDGGVKVEYADAWLKSRQVSFAALRNVDLDNCK